MDCGLGFDSRRWGVVALSALELELRLELVLRSEPVLVLAPQQDLALRLLVVFRLMTSCCN